MSQASISGLSNETLLQNFHHFCLHCQDRYNQSWDVRPLRTRHPREKQESNAKSWYSLNRQALFSMSLASKRFRDISQQVLYHEFVLGYGDSWVSKMYFWSGRLVSFMRTLTKSPDLAKLVKVAYIHTDLLGAGPEETRAVLMETAHGLGIDLPNAWRQRISGEPNHETHDWPDGFNAFLFSFLDGKENPNPKAKILLKEALSYPAYRWLNAELVAMLVALLPNLDYLSVQGGNSWPKFGFPQYALSALEISRLPLKTLDLGVGGNAIIELAAGLETLNLHQISIVSPVPLMPTLKTLRITEGQLTVEELQAILTACTGGLKAFEYESAEAKIISSCDGTSLFGTGFYHFQPSEAIKYLKVHRRTLELLHLDLMLRDEHIRNFQPDVDLKDFMVLEHLFLSSNTLFDRFFPDPDDVPDSEALVRLLPASIVSLSIISYSNRRKGIKESLLGLADLKTRQPNEFPRLKHISGVANQHTRIMLRSLFSSIGVKYGNRVPRLSKVMRYLNGPNSTTALLLPVWVSDEDL